jgi:branched-chain amino acid transport system permease protein
MTLPAGRHGGALTTASTADVAATSQGPLHGLPVLVRHLLWALVGLAAVYGLSIAFGPFRNVQLANVAYLACAAAGLSVLTGLSGQISLGHGAFMAIGAYGTALLFEHASGVPLAVVLLLAALGTAAVGALVGAAAARLRGPYLAGATLAFAVGLPALADWRRLSGTLGGQNGLVVVGPGVPGGLDVPLDRWQLWVAGSALVVTLFLLANLSRSRVGRSWRAVRDDEIAAELAGLSVARLQIQAFVVSAGCAGLGGALLAYVTGLAAPGAFQLTLSLALLTAVVLGGLGSLAGAVYGALLLVFLPTWTTSAATSLHLSRDVYANLPLALYGLVLMLVMLLFPQGLQGALRRVAGPVLARARKAR